MDINTIPFEMSSAARLRMEEILTELDALPLTAESIAERISFLRCLERLCEWQAGGPVYLTADWAPRSFGFSWERRTTLIGGLIWFESDRTWSIHT